MTDQPADPSERGRDAEGSAAPRPRPSWVSGALRWTLELVVVFVGVYAAFALARYEQRHDEDAYRAQIEAALAREIEGVLDNTRRVATQIPRIAASYDSLIDAGARPRLDPTLTMEPIRVRNHMWEATLESGGLDVLDVPTLYRASLFYNELNAGFEQLAQLRHLSETLLLPNLERGSDEFYDPSTGELLPKYQWYVDGLHRLGDLAVDITNLGDELVAELADPEDLTDD